MQITILCVGKLKEKYLKAGVEEYTKRLGAYGKISLIEVADEKCPDRGSDREKEIVRQKEAERILAKLPPSAWPVTLEIGGRMLSSEELARELDGMPHKGVSHVAFIIGGSLGLDESVRKRSKLALSFSKMTFPHQLMRLILTEQIYRAFTIIQGTPYHK
ncbi:MAG: 23S rRNA (pseudouridine(1915)-N(3))-methyltransferase RlmH [Spirochaetales bacterium]|nr:23S rRNA (pseudouridine(1915)-N(3))-methyltransferase RlmH [Spirochaetales bacterium]